MPFTIEDIRKQAKEDAVKLINQCKTYDSELKSLNEEYGDRVRLLTKKQPFECEGCGHQGELVPHEKILKREYRIILKPRVYFQDGLPPYSFTTFDLVFLIECGCSKNNEVHTAVTLRHALKVLREERDLVGNGKEPTYKSMIV